MRQTEAPAIVRPRDWKHTLSNEVCDVLDVDMSYRADRRDRSALCRCCSHMAGHVECGNVDCLTCRECDDANRCACRSCIIRPGVDALDDSLDLTVHGRRACAEAEPRDGWRLVFPGHSHRFPWRMVNDLPRCLGGLGGAL